MLTREDTKSIVQTCDIARYFDMDGPNTSRAIRLGARLDLLYIVLNRTLDTDPERDLDIKREYIMRTSLTEYYKQKVWNIYRQTIM